MLRLPDRSSLSWRKAFGALAGNLATSLWWWPGLAKRLHRWRGVRFADPASVFLGRGVLIDNRHPDLVEIGADVWLTAGCVVLTHSFASRMQRERHGMDEAVGPVTFEDGAFVGAGSIILPGVRIGRGAYVAAGSVVTADVPPDTLVAGNPARVVRRLTPGRDGGA